MLAACIQGKTGERNVLESEDVLTSNVFGFFKYANREVFLRGFLEHEKISKELPGLVLSSDNLRDATFEFWPSYGIEIGDDAEKQDRKKDVETTEPDLVMIVGNYYILFEAKLKSDFHPKTDKKESQLAREIKGGESDAIQRDLKFKLITITGHYYYDKDTIYKNADAGEYINSIGWINWHAITSVIERGLETEQINNGDKLFGQDLLELLYMQGLRSFYGWQFLDMLESVEFSGDRLFHGSPFYKGVVDGLSSCTEIGTFGTRVFFEYDAAKHSKNRR